MLFGAPNHVYVDLLVAIAHPYELPLPTAARGDAIAGLFSEEFSSFLGKRLFLPCSCLGTFSLPFVVVGFLLVVHRPSLDFHPHSRAHRYRIGTKFTEREKRWT